MDTLRRVLKNYRPDREKIWVSALERRKLAQREKNLGLNLPNLMHYSASPKDATDSLEEKLRQIRTISQDVREKIQLSSIRISTMVQQIQTQNKQLEEEIVQLNDKLERFQSIFSPAECK